MFCYLGPAGAACGLSELALLVSACLHNDCVDHHDHHDRDDEYENDDHRHHQMNTMMTLMNDEYLFKF